MPNFDPAFSFSSVRSEKELLDWANAYRQRTQQEMEVNKYVLANKDTIFGAPILGWVIVFNSGSGVLRSEAYFFIERSGYADQNAYLRPDNNQSGGGIRCFGALSGLWAEDFVLSFDKETRVISVTARYRKRSWGTPVFGMKPDWDTTRDRLIFSCCTDFF